MLSASLLSAVSSLEAPSAVLAASAALLVPLPVEQAAAETIIRAASKIAANFLILLRFLPVAPQGALLLFLKGNAVFPGVIRLISYHIITVK